MFIPYRVDVPMHRWPISNFVIIALAVVAFIYQSSLSNDELWPLILNGWRPLGLFAHMWLHGDWLHLIGNMLFLWVFGNAVCAKVGNLVYPVLYVAFGLAAAAGHVIFGGGPALGASGAINGVVGAYLALYPLNNISCLLLLWLRFICFSVSSYWIILLFLAFDIWGAVRGGAQIAYHAHLGGFAAGLGLIVLALTTRLLRMEITEKSLLQVLGFQKRQPERERLAAGGRPPEHWAAPPEEPRGPKTMLETMAGEPAPGVGPRVAISKPPPSRPLPKQDISRPPRAGPTRPAGPPAQADTVLMKCICGKRLRVPRTLSGRQAKCPACSQIIQIPEL